MVKHDILDITISKVPMFKPLIGYVIGIALAYFYDFPIIEIFPYVFVFGVLLVFYFYSKRKVIWGKNGYTFLFYILFLLLGICNADRANPKFNTNHFSHFNAHQIIGIIEDEPIYKEKSIRFPVRVISVRDSSNSIFTSGKLMIILLRDSLENRVFTYGNQIIFKNKIQETNPPYNPKEFDYKKFLANKSIWHQCLLTNKEILIADHNVGNRLIQYSLRIREDLIRKFDKYIDNEKAYQIAVALIFGYRSQIDAETISAFTNTGTIHILSVSGLHVSLVFAFLTFILIGMDRFRYGRLIRSAIILIVVWFYVILTGMSPSILRAGIMISFFIISTATRRKQVSVNTLLASAFFILLFAPDYLFDVGFQLSYSAMFGIFLLYPILRSFYLPNNKYVGWVVEYSYVSIAAQIFTMPLALYYFGQFPNYFLLANLFIAIPSTLIMWLGISLAFVPFNVINSLIGKALDYLLIFSVEGLRFIERLPFATIQGIDWNIWLTILSIFFISALVLGLNYKNKYALFAVLISLCCMTISLNVISYTNTKTSRYRIYHVRNQIAIAYVYNGQVVLYSTLDSITHPTLQFAVWYDLKRFSKIKDIYFQQLKNVERNNYSFELGAKKFLVLEEKTDNEFDPYDFVIWRKNNFNDIKNFTSIAPKIIIDGSNSDKTIDKLSNQMSNNPSTVYLLKNNFAYVWDEEQK